MEPPPPSSPPHQKEPSPKKLKMSTTTTTTDDDSTTTNASDRKPRYKRRKVAIFFAYCGVGYQGMQKNPGAKTIEGDLEEALFHAGAVPEQDRGHPKRYDWARSARTDKGVSAVGQVVSGRFYVDPPGLVARLNSMLPEQFRIFGFKRVTASFSAKKFCDRRRYVYLLPVFALDPFAHRDRESVLESLGSGNEIVKCLECPERGRKVEGMMGNKRDFVAKDDFFVGSINGANDAQKEAINAIKFENGNGLNSLVQVSDLVVENVTVVENDSGLDRCTEVELVAKADGGSGNGEERSKFCYGEKEKERFNRILSSYVGTHNFYNFTTRIKAEDPSCQRYVVSFEANTVVNVDGIDFVKCEVVGQSFMLHQIRKMMGLAVAIMRNSAPESLLEHAFQKGVSITVPTAPEVGLYLDECYFTSYNSKWKDTHEEVSMKDYAEEAEEFKMKHIYSHIASMERKEGIIGLWLHSLNYRNYADFRAVNNEAVIDTTVEATNIKTDVDTIAELKDIEAASGTNVLGTIDDSKSEATGTDISADKIPGAMNAEA